MNRRVVITGAAEGIGRALAEEFGLQSDAITCVDVNTTLAEQTQAALRKHGIAIDFCQADLSLAQDRERMVRELVVGPQIDVLIHCAGINCVGPFVDSNIAAQCKVLDINLTAPLQVTAALLQTGAIARHGSLVFISSLSRFASYPGASVYAATKDGLASYARGLAVALAPQDIHVLTVYPGPTRTAHARRYSPDNSREARRMQPARLAAEITRAVKHRKHTLVPGFGNQAFAMLGRWAPPISEWLMARTLWKQLAAGYRTRIDDSSNQI